MKGRARIFDWDEARRLWEDGHSYDAIGRMLGVTGQAVRLAVDPVARQQARDRHAEWQRRVKPHAGPCADCGGPCSQARWRPGSRCKPCADRAHTTTVRADTLQCSCCRLWLPDDAFPQRQTARARRYRHAICTPCGRVMKRDWRALHADRERAKDRERKRRQRAAA